MIKNLPKQVSLDQLLSFNFGDIEGNDDKLLYDSICKTASIYDFLNGDKTIISGEKGSGKTALFRLLRDGKLQFNRHNNHRILLLSIDDNFLYKHVKGHITNLISSKINDEYFKYHIVWEMFLFHKIIHFLVDQGIDLTATLKNALTLLNEMFGTNKVNGFLDLFKNAKKSFGIRLYETPAGYLPGLVFESEPVKVETDPSAPMAKLEIDLDKFKKEISELLNINNYKLIILIDRLDEFVSKNELPIQLEMLYSLIVVEREFHRFQNIDLKIFLRDDLFNQISIEGMDYDKIIAKKINLIWNPEQIREFIAKRIIYNYKNIFKLQSLQLRINQQNLEVSSTEIKEIISNPTFLQRIYSRILKALIKSNYEEKFARKINLTDDINKQIILSIFPKQIEHRNTQGKVISIDIFDFFSTHFNLGSGNTVPRLYIYFLNKLFEIIKDYYQKNFDSLPKLNEEIGSLELIKNGFFSQAYKDFQHDIYINFSKLNLDFEAKICLLKERKGQRYSFKAKELKGLLDFDNSESLTEFCDYLVHIGLFTKSGKSSNIENQHFEIPILFRN